jgi:hypothetical protein
MKVLVDIACFFEGNNHALLANPKEELVTRMPSQDFFTTTMA